MTIKVILIIWGSTSIVFVLFLVFRGYVLKPYWERKEYARSFNQLNTIRNDKLKNLAKFLFICANNDVDIEVTHKGYGIKLIWVHENNLILTMCARMIEGIIYSEDAVYCEHTEFGGLYNKDILVTEIIIE